MKYQITQEGNYLKVRDLTRREDFYGSLKEVFIQKNNIAKESYRLYNVKNFSENNILEIGNIYKEDGSLYTISEWEDFYTTMEEVSSKIPTLDSSKTPVIPSMTNGGNIAVTTNSTGTNYTEFASQACKQLNISNQSGTTIEVQQGGSGVGFQIPTGAFYTFFGITNTNQLGIRRLDTSNTQVTITARWEV